jgi:hypothetical protein
MEIFSSGWDFSHMDEFIIRYIYKHILELSVKSSKESTKTVNLLKTRNKVVEVEWVHSKIEHEEGTTVGSKLGTST